jgi:RNA polymerase sigma-70 factor (ECF subfamily)
VQETFLAAIENPHGWRGEGSVFAWLVGVLNNLSRAARRRGARQADRSAVRDDVAPDPHELAEHDELRATLQKQIATLPGPLVPVLKLHLDHQLTAKEIADALQRPAGTVRTQIVRGLEMLRKLLPRGLALALLVRQPGRGIDAVRDAVVGAADKLCAAERRPASCRARPRSPRPRSLPPAVLIVAGGATAWIALRASPDAGEPVATGAPRERSRGKARAVRGPSPRPPRPRETARMRRGHAIPGAPRTHASALRSQRARSVPVLGVGFGESRTSQAGSVPLGDGVVVQAWQPVKDKPSSSPRGSRRDDHGCRGRAPRVSSPGRRPNRRVPDPSGRRSRPRERDPAPQVECSTTMTLVTGRTAHGRIVARAATAIAGAGPCSSSTGSGSTRHRRRLARTARSAGR